jgi:dolichol-phosphate mannosyltransferase
MVLILPNRSGLGQVALETDVLRELLSSAGAASGSPNNNMAEHFIISLGGAVSDCSSRGGGGVSQTEKQHKPDPAVSVVVPVRNEAGNIAPLVQEITDVLKGLSFEVIYVNDDSNDATEAELLALMAEQPRLRLIRHAKPCGQSAALRTGVLMARGPIVVTLDGDCQNDPAVIPAMIDTLEAGRPRLGLVAGQRVGRKATLFKKLQSRIANGVRRAILRDGTRDTGCGLKALRRDLFRSLPYFDSFHCFLPALVRREGFEVAYVDVLDRPRHHGVTHYGMWDRLWVGILDTAGVWWLIRRAKHTPQAEEIRLAP